MIVAGLIISRHKNLLCQLRLHNSIRQFIANDIGEDPSGLAVPNALSSTRFRVNFDLQPQSREANA